MVDLVGLDSDQAVLPVVDIVLPLGVRPRRARPVEVDPVAAGIVGIDEGLAVIGLGAHPQGLEELIRRIVGGGDLKAVLRPRGGLVIAGPPAGTVREP